MKHQVGDTIECDAICGWVRAVYERISQSDQLPQFVYAIEEPESEAIFYFSEEDL